MGLCTREAHSGGRLSLGYIAIDMNPPPRLPTYPEEQPRDEPRDAAARVSPPSASTAARDIELVRRMAAGDEQALAALYDHWSGLVSSLVMHLLGDADESEDVLEETFWQAWRQALRYDAARASVSTWLTTIARSRALDRLRARRRRPEESLSQLSEEGTERIIEREAVADDPLADTEAAERQSRVAAALQSLPREQRETIELAYFGGLSQTEIATRMQQPLGTVKTRVRLAVEKLRERLSMLAEDAR